MIHCRAIFAAPLAAICRILPQLAAIRHNSLQFGVIRRNSLR
jgi:hypothetical protein